MKLYTSFLSIGILLTCIYYNLGSQDNNAVETSSHLSSGAENKKEDSVKLYNFQSRQSGNKTELYWMVDKNEKVNQFEVEKSNDGKNFKVAALVFGTDKVNTDSYMFYEKATGKKTFYQVRIIDNKGVISYSDIIEVNP